MPDSLVRVLEPEHVGLARSWAPKVDELGRAHRRAAHQRSCGGLLLHRSADPSRPTRQRSADEPSRPTVCRPPLSPSTRNVRIDPTSEAAQGQPRPGGYPVIIRMVAISSAPTGRGSWSRRNIVRFHLRLLSRLNHRRHPRRVSSHAMNCRSACWNCALAAKTATVAPACGLAS